jgi:hypothetical protein
VGIFALILVFAALYLMMKKPKMPSGGGSSSSGGSSFSEMKTVSGDAPKSPPSS